MASSGPNSPSTVVNDSGYGTYAWSNPSNAASQNDTYASAQANAVGDTQYLKSTNFGFSIPSGATINGIVVEYDVYESGAGAADDQRVRIVKGGTIGTTDRQTDTAYPATDGDTYQSRGGSTDLWGETWSDTDINASNFGVAIACNGAGNNNIYIDHVRITVHYTESGGVTVSPSPASAIASKVDPSVSVGGNVSVSPSPSTAVAVSINPTVVTSGETNYVPRYQNLFSRIRRS